MLVIVKFNNLMFSPKSLNNFDSFNWGVFETYENVYVEELGLGYEENCLQFEYLNKDRVILSFDPVLASDANNFFENFTCVGV